jgi:phage shock protein A
VVNVFSHDKIRSSVESAINEIASDFDAKPYLNTVFERKDYIIDLVKKSYIDELITPLLEQIQEARSKREEREVNLQKAQTRLSELEEAIKRLDRQIEEMAILAKSVS